MKSHITSTPVTNSNKSGSLPASPNHSRLTPNLRSPKYLIASPSCGTPLRRSSDNGRSSPLLNSSVNVRLYTNTQSPGLASRIVQYDKVQNGRSPTHNRKFGSPGIFPIVHLYKHNLPEVSPKPKKVTVKIAPPDDLSMFSHIDHSIIMSENARITTFPENSANETGTRSVLDALKEISRKRIHSAAEFETSPEATNRKRNKRILEAAANQANISSNSLNITPQFNSTASNNKRAREESPQDVNCVSQSTTTVDNSTNAAVNNGNEKSNNPKRYCSIDPITASFTSANLRFAELRKNASKKRLEDYQEDLPGSPLRKIRHVSVDTQTNITELLEPITDQLTEQQTRDGSTFPQVAEQPEASTDADTFANAVKAVNHVKERPIFDPKPLEVIRRNKLAALLGAISGQKPVLEKVPLPDVLNSRQNDPIVNNTNNSLMPLASILSNNTSPFQGSTEVVPREPPKHVSFDLPSSNLSPVLLSNPNITQTTTALVMPISSAMVVPSASISSPIDTTNFFANTSVVPHSIGTLPQSSPPKAVGGFKFDLQQPSTTPMTTNAISLTSSTAGCTSSLPSIAFNSPQPQNPSNQTSLVPSSNAIVSTLNPPSTTSTGLNSGVPNFGFNFGSPKVPQQTSTQPAILEAPKPALSFGLPNPVSTSNSVLALPSTATVASPSFNFGTTNSAVTNSVTPGPILFGAVSTNSVVLSTTSTTVAKPSFSFETKAALPSIEASKPSANSVPLFGSTALTTNMFAKPSGISSPFQVSNDVTSNNIVAIPSTTGTTAGAIVGFPLTTTASTTFGQLGTTNNLFGGITTSNATNATATFSFGGSSTSNIPVTTSTSNSTGLSFSSTVAASNPAAKPAFGTANNAVVTTESSNIFGTSPFASTTPATSSSTFGGFGTKFGDTALAIIPANNQAVAPASSLFSFGGSTSTEQPKMFGNAVANNSGTSTPTFGASASGAPKVTFGGFGGTANSTFGNHQTSEVAPIQTVQANNSTFGFGSSTNAFDTSSTFNKPGTFGGAPNSSFPTPSFAAAQPQPSKLFTFGNAAAVPKPAEPPVDKPGGVFAFGTPIAKPQATPGGFNFSAGSTSAFGVASAAPAFGAGANPAPVMFGTAQASPAFNVSGGFNAPALVGSPGMFSIGSGSSTGPSRPRTQLKPKRRT